MKRYVLISMSMALALLIMYQFLNDQVFNGALHDLFPVVVLFSFFQSLMILQIIRLGQQTSWESPFYALGTVFVRLITSLIFFVILGMKGASDLKPLAIQFIVIYLVYLVFELNAVLANLRRN